MPMERVSAGAVRHGGDAGSGHDVGTAVAPRELQPGQPGAGGGHRARGAGALASERLGVAPRRPGRRRRRGARRGRRLQAGELRGAARRAPLRPGARRGGEAPASQHVEGAGHCPCPGSICPAWSPARPSSSTRCRCPGMLHGRVVRPPSVGATLARVNDAAVRSMPGVVKVVTKGNFVGVVAEKAWQAVQAAAKLEVTWTPGPALAAPARRLPGHPQAAGARHAARGLRRRGRDAGQGGNGAARHLPASRTRCTARWAVRAPSPTCAPIRPRCGRPRSRRIPTRDTTAMLLGLPADRVRVVYVRGSGCYGINGADTVTYDAALLSQAVGRPGEGAALPQGRDGVGELREPVRHRPADRPRPRRHDRRVGLRGVVRRPRRAARLCHARQRRHRAPARHRAGARAAAHAGARADDAARQQPEHRAVLHRRPRRRQPERRRRRAQRARAVAPRALAVLHRARCGRPSGCRTRSRTRASWTRSPRT